MVAQESLLVSLILLIKLIRIVFFTLSCKHAQCLCMLYLSANFFQKLPILRDQTCFVLSMKKFNVQYSYQLTFSTLIALLIHFHIDFVFVSAMALDKGDLDQNITSNILYIKTLFVANVTSM